MLPGKVCLTAHHRMQMDLRGRRLWLGEGLWTLWWWNLITEIITTGGIFPPLEGKASTVRWRLAHDPFWKSCLRPWSFRTPRPGWCMANSTHSSLSKAQVVSYNLQKPKERGTPVPKSVGRLPSTGGRPRTLSKHRYPQSQQRKALPVPEASAGPWVKSEYSSETSG